MRKLLTNPYVLVFAGTLLAMAVVAASKPRADRAPCSDPKGTAFSLHLEGSDQYVVTDLCSIATELVDRGWQITNQCSNAACETREKPSTWTGKKLPDALKGDRT